MLRMRFRLDGANRVHEHNEISRQMSFEVVHNLHGSAGRFIVFFTGWVRKPVIRRQLPVPNPFPPSVGRKNVSLEQPPCPLDWINPFGRVERFHCLQPRVVDKVVPLIFGNTAATQEAKHPLVLVRVVGFNHRRRCSLCFSSGHWPYSSICSHRRILPLPKGVDIANATCGNSSLQIDLVHSAPRNSKPLQANAQYRKLGIFGNPDPEQEHWKANLKSGPPSAAPVPH